MTISYINAAAATSNSVNLPSGWVPGDLAIVFAYVTSSTAITTPSGWTSKGSGTPVSQAWNIGYRYLQSGDTSTGTWTNASKIGVIIYRGIHSNYPIGQILNNPSSGTTVTIPQLTRYYSNSLSVGMVFTTWHTSNADALTTTSLTNNRTNNIQDDFGIADAISNIGASETYTISAGTNWVSISLELLENSLFPIIADADTTSGTVTTNSSSWTLTYPTNIAAGDLLLALVAIDGATSITYPSGWQDVENIYDANGTPSLNYAQKIATGSETGTFEVTLSGSEQGSWLIYRIPAGTWYGTGLISGVGNHVAGSTQEGLALSEDHAVGASTSPDPPSLNPSNWNAENTLWFAFMAADTSRTVSAYPSSPDTFTNTGSLVSGGSNGATLGWGRLEKNAASVDPGTFTISNSDDWVAVTIAIRPRQYFSVVAQAQAQISSGPDKRAYSQVIASIKSTSNSYAQGQADIKQTYNAYAQSQASIVSIKRGYAQAVTLVNGTYFSVLDTFTRSVSENWGTNDTGDTWTVDNASKVNVNGTQGTIVHDLGWPRNYLPRTLISAATGGIFVKGQISIDKIPQTDHEYFYIYPMRNAITGSSFSASNENAACTILIKTDSTIVLNLGVLGYSYNASVGNYTAGETWNFVGLWLKSSGSNPYVTGKIWKDGTAEPGWSGSTLPNGVNISTLSGYPALGFVSGSTASNYPFTYIIDNLEMGPAGLTRYAQAQAKIISNAATETRAYSQTQADILTTYNRYSQAQACIKQTYNAYAQAGASIFNGVGLGQALAKIANSQIGIRRIYTADTSSSSTSIDIPIEEPDENSVLILSFFADLSDGNAPTITGGGKTWTPASNSYRFGDAEARIYRTTNTSDASSITNIHITWNSSNTDYHFQVWEVVNAIKSPFTSYGGSGEVDNSVIDTIDMCNYDYTYGAFYHRIYINVIGVVTNTGALSTDDAQNLAQQDANFGSARGSSRTFIDWDDIEINQGYTSQIESVSIGTDYAWAWIMLGEFPPRVVAQAQAQIVTEATETRVYAQTQAHIFATSNQYAQAQADIQQTYNVYSQAQARIVQHYLGHAQANVRILSTYQSYAQAQGYILSIVTVYGQSQASIIAQVVTTSNHAQALAEIYIPVYARPVSDVANNGWVRVVI